MTRGSDPAPEPEVTLRPAAPGDLPFLHDVALAKALELARPVVARYLAGWGRAGDAALVAVAGDGQPLGGAWYRLYAATPRGDGIVAWAGVPEVALLAAGPGAVAIAGWPCRSTPRTPWCASTAATASAT